MTKCKIDEVIHLGGQFECPILAHFQNGIILPECAKDFDCYLAKKTTENSTERLALTVNNDSVYSGTIGKGFPTDLERTFIGIRNKVSNKVRRNDSSC